MFGCGIALYQAIATPFLAHIFAVSIGLGMILNVIMATGATVGSPGAAEVGIGILRPP